MRTSQPEASAASKVMPLHTQPQAVQQGDCGGAARNGVPFVSCVVPCYDEADSLRTLLPRLIDFLAARYARWEIVLVDDGSTDETSSLLSRWLEQEERLVVIELSRNFGKEAALTAGLQAVQGDVVVLLDADLQHSPNHIEQMMERWRAGFDVVYAARQERPGGSRLKKLCTHAFYRLINLGNPVPVPTDAGDFRLMDRSVVDALLGLPERTRFMKGLYAWVGFRTDRIPYVPDQRYAGRSRFGARMLAVLALSGLTAFTTWPLRVGSAVGALIAVLSIAYGGYVTLSYLLYGNPVSGWTTIVVLLSLLSGIQLLCVGVLGEYLGRVFDEVKGRPLYVVRRRLQGRARPTAAALRTECPPTARDEREGM
jgi:glycosyltransferase involved in cell wall biosynthesis